MPDMTATVETLPILLVPDPILKARARPVGAGEMERVRELVPLMLATMYRAPGIGLAAPQVGVGLRFAVVDLMPDDKPTPIALINPEVTARSEEQATREEGCLSLPDIRDKVQRYNKVKLRALDRNGKPFELEAEGLMAQCIQHEIDHLDGKLYIDYLSSLKRERIKKKLLKQRESA